MNGDKENLVELLRQCVTQNITTDPDIWDGIVDVNYVGMADLLLAHGVIVLPCKVGDTVWDRKAEPWTVFSIEWFARKVFHIRCTSPVTGRQATFAIGKRSIGKTVFLTREEAGAALRKEGQ